MPDSQGPVSLDYGPAELARRITPRQRMGAWAGLLALVSGLGGAAIAVALPGGWQAVGIAAAALAAAGIVLVAISIIGYTARRL